MVLSIIFEIFVFLYIAFYFERTYMSRFPKNNNDDLNAWHELISFIYLNKGYDISDIANDFEKLQLKDKDKNTNKNKNININNYEKTYICTPKQDRIIRICCINYAYLKGYPHIKNDSKANDIRLLHYLQQEQASSFCHIIEYDDILKNSSRINLNFDITSNINSKSQSISNNISISQVSQLATLTNIDSNKKNYTNSNSNINGNNKKTSEKKNGKHVKISFLKKFWIVYSGLWHEVNEQIVIKSQSIEATFSRYIDNVDRRNQLFGLIMIKISRILVGLITFIFGPLYIISRLFSFFFPLIIVVYLFIDSSSSAHDIDIVQWCMLIIYSILVMIVLVLNVFMFYYSYYESFILPNNKFETLYPFSKEFVEYVKDYCYPQVMIVPIRDYLVRQAFGKDVGNIIISYLFQASNSSTLDNFKTFLIKYKGESDNHSALRDFTVRCHAAKI